MKKPKKEAKEKKEKEKEKETSMSMGVSSVSNVYLHVVEDVINNVRSDFQSEGVDENVLNELQTLWELRMVQLGAIQEAPSHESPRVEPISEPVAGPPVHDLNVPYSATEEPYVAPPSDSMFGRVNPPTGSREPVMFQYIPAGPSEESTRQSSGHHLPLTMGNGTPSSYMQQPAPWMNQKRRGVELNMNETYVERDEGDNGLAQLPVTKDFLNISTGKRKYDEISSGYYIPQRDGSTDGATDGATDDELCTSMGEASNIKTTGEFEF